MGGWEVSIRQEGGGGMGGCMGEEIVTRVPLVSWHFSRSGISRSTGHFQGPWFLVVCIQTCHLASLAPPFRHLDRPWADLGALGSTRKDTLGIDRSRVEYLFGLALYGRQRAAPHWRSGVRGVGQGGASRRHSAPSAPS